MFAVEKGISIPPRKQKFRMYTFQIAMGKFKALKNVGDSFSVNTTKGFRSIAYTAAQYSYLNGGKFDVTLDMGNFKTVVKRIE